MDPLSPYEVESEAKKENPQSSLRTRQQVVGAAFACVPSSAVDLRDAKIPGDSAVQGTCLAIVHLAAFGDPKQSAMSQQFLHAFAVAMLQSPTA